MKYNYRALTYAIGHFLSDWDRSIPSEKLLEMMYDDSADILPWEPFETMPTTWLAEHIENMAVSLTGEDFRLSHGEELPASERLNRYHIEYVVHVYVNAENEDEARELGSLALENADDMDYLAGDCEFVAIEIEEGQ